MDSLFREYDIRGIADDELSNEFAWALGRALADKLHSLNEKTVYIGRDVRSSSPRLSASLASGLENGDIQVKLLSPGPTPLLYFSCYEEIQGFKCSSGIMITGSHNPSEYNGFKMVLGGTTIHGKEIHALKGGVKKYLPEAPKNPTQNSAQEIDIYDDYINTIAPGLKALKNPITVVVDAGNGAGGQLGIRLYEKMGCKVIPLYCDFDSNFPNHHPDPTIPENLVDLQKAVKDHKADVGIAYDGDGDRIGAVSPEGKILFGDQLLLYFTREILKTEKAPKIISEVKASQVVFDEISKMGAEAIIWKTGHSLIKAKLKESNAALAGEMSGHIFFAHRFYGFDDGIYSGARLIEAIDANHPESLDTFLKAIPEVKNTPELRIDCPEEKKFGIVSSFVNNAQSHFGPDKVLDIDGARVKCHDGWGLIRASNTQPVLVMRFEAPDQARLEKISSDFSEILKKIDSSIKVPVV